MPYHFSYSPRTQQNVLAAANGAKRTFVVTYSSVALIGRKSKAGKCSHHLSQKSWVFAKQSVIVNSYQVHFPILTTFFRNIAKMCPTSIDNSHPKRPIWHQPISCSWWIWIKMNSTDFRIWIPNSSLTFKLNWNEENRNKKWKQWNEETETLNL